MYDGQFDDVIMIGTTKRDPINWSSHTNSFEDRVPLDEIYNGVAVTWQEW